MIQRQSFSLEDKCSMINLIHIPRTVFLNEISEGSLNNVELLQ